MVCVDVQTMEIIARIMEEITYKLQSSYVRYVGTFSNQSSHIDNRWLRRYYSLKEPL